MPLKIPAKAQNHFAKVWLDAACTVTRVTGRGANSNPVTIDTDMAYKQEVLGNPEFVSMDDGTKVLLTHLMKFAVDSNVRTKDVIVDNETGERFRLEGKLSRTFKFLDSFTAISLQRSPGG